MAARQPSIEALLAQSGHRNEAVKRLSTDPAKHYMNAVKKVKLRSKTEPSQIFTDDITAETYGARLFGKLLTGLESHNLSTLHLALRHYEWLVPPRDASPDILAIFDQVSMAAPTVTHADLAKIFTMEESTVTSPLGIDGFHYFYIRELVFTGQELAGLINYMRASDDGFEECSEWNEMLQIYGTRGTNGFDTWTLRYVGTVEGPRRPIDRYNDDLEYQLVSILGEAYRAIESLHPHIMRDAKVYMLPDATLSPDSGAKAEDTERPLIELFHHPSLLNRQRGGHNSSYVPTQDEANLFMALKTDAWQTFKLGAQMTPDSMEDALVAHFEKVQEYANNYPAETGTAVHPYTDRVRQVAFEQARPSQYQGTTVLAFLGKDITITDFIKAQSFWDGGSQASVLTKGILQRTADSEMASHDRGYLRNIHNQLSLWCFADLWPWLWHKNQAQAMFFLCEYLNIIRPLVAVSYGRPVNSITRADFQHDNGVSKSGSSPFTEIIAQSSIQFYDHHEHGGHPREECAYINIPHHHPGRDKYGQQDVRLRRFFEMSMQETFVIVDLALKTLDKHSKDVTPPSRLDLCKEIMHERNSLRKDAAYKAFSDALADARVQCKLYFSSSVRSSTDDVRPVLDKDGRLTLLGLGRAEGQPSSDERFHQLDQLWEINMPDLHIHVAHSPENKDKWIGTFKDLQTGQFLYLAALAHCEPDEYFDHVFEKFAPEGSDKLWFKDQRARGQAVLNAGLWVARKLENDEELKPRLRVHFPSAYIPASEMQNSPIGIVQSNGIARVRWKKDRDTNITVRVISKIAIPKMPHETRVLHFTQDGLDIIDAFGNPFRAIGRNGQPISATIPRAQFGDKPDLLSLWRAVLKAENITIPEEDDDDESAALTFDWGPKGVPALTQKSKSMQPRQNRPVPDPADANYILYKFLDEPDFRNGGVFDPTDAADKIGSPEHVKRLVEFVKDQQWAGHPYRDWWLSNFDRDRPETAILAKNIPVLRNCTSDRRHFKSATRKTGDKPTRATSNLLVIGGPNSAFDDPFDAANGQSCSVKPRKKKKAEPQAEEDEGVESDDDDDDEDEEPRSGLGKGKLAATSKRRAAMGGSRQ
jgi:hypothetical protein